MMHFFKRTAVALATLTVVAAALPVHAQQPAAAAPMKPTPGMAPMAHSGGGTAAPDSLMGAMDKMSKDMAAVPMTGDSDRDFAAMMIPHHQAAIDMARYQLAHGKDPVMLKLARAVVAAQEKEISEMKQWLARHSTR